MSTPLPWSTASPSSSSDATELLRQIATNSTDQLLWTKILTGAVGLLVLVLIVAVA